MSTKKSAGVSVLAISTATVWLLGVEMANPPKIVAALSKLAHPASIISGAGAVCLSFLRLRAFANERGSISLVRTGAVVLTALAVVFVVYDGGGSLTHHLSEYVVECFVLAYVFVVILRSK